MIHAVIFDLGNTLVYFSGDWEEVTARGIEALTRYLVSTGIDVNQDWAADFIATRAHGREVSIRSDVEYTAENALRDSLARHGFADPPAEVIECALEVFFAPEEAHWGAYPDARQALEQLQMQDLRMGLISNATDDGFVRRLVRREGLTEFFNPIVSSAAVPWRKPDPRIFRYVLDRWKLAPGEVMMVGDWPSMDVLGAHRAGMRAVLIEERWPDPPRAHAELPDAQLLTPDVTIRNLDELTGALERLDHD